MKQPESRMIEQINEWMFDHALPFWFEHAVDRTYGGFVEALTLDGEDAGLDYKRTRVTCRQIYVFAHAAMIGQPAPANILEDGVSYLMQNAWRKDDAGFVRRLTRAGEVLDPAIDLYDNAFALFAFAWAFGATSNPRYKSLCSQTLDAIEATLRDRDGAGFWQAEDKAGWRLQNPHMHLLEAALCAFRFTGDQRYAALAEELLALFSTRFFQPDSGALAEFFTASWTPAPGDAGQHTEPGHEFEWAWIIDQAYSLIGVDKRVLGWRLAETAERKGVGPGGRVINAMTSAGATIDAGSRTWPNTERIKAGVALCRESPETGRRMALESCAVLFSDYLTPSPSSKFPMGCWQDAFDRNGAPVAMVIPASTLYHLFLAFAEARERLA